MIPNWPSKLHLFFMFRSVGSILHSVQLLYTKDTNNYTKTSLKSANVNELEVAHKQCAS